MSPVKEFIQILKTDYHTYEKSFKSLLKNYSRVQDLVMHVLEWIPAEFFFLLILSVIILIILNSVSPSTRKVNLIFSVLAAAGLYLSIAKLSLNKVRFDRTFPQTIFSSLFILGPAYTFYLIVFLVESVLKKMRRRRLAHPSTIEKSFLLLQSSYKDAMYEYYQLADKGNDTSDLREKVEELILASQGTLRLLKPIVKEEPFESQPLDLEENQTV